MSEYILAVNCGSSSLKITLFERDSMHQVADAHIKEIHSISPKLVLNWKLGSTEYDFTHAFTIVESLKKCLEQIERDCQIDLLKVVGIGHRFVHGGSKYISSVLIDDQVMKDLSELTELAPLHNPACFDGIKGCFDCFGTEVPQLVAFDTAFFRTLPPVAASYALPLELSEKYQIKRYGFHGISHEFLWDTYHDQVKTGNSNAKVITMHLGNGCSMTAIKDGMAMDTSMGFTPAEGLVMGTRAGDIDSAVMEFLCLYEDKPVNEVMKVFNFKSGLLGISGSSSQMDVLEKSYENNDRSRLAVDMFCYRVIKYLGAYLNVLEGAEGIIFSGGIGENSVLIRKKVIQGMSWMGIKLDDDVNQKAVNIESGALFKISASDSKIAVYVIGTDENYFVAKEVVGLLN